MHSCDEMLYDQIRLINSELLKHQHFFRYGNNESVRIHDIRHIPQKNSEFHRIEKCLITVKLFTYMWSDKLRLNSKSTLQMHQRFCEHGDADSLSPHYTTHNSDQSTAIHFARRNLKPNRVICYNHSKLTRKNK